MAEGNRMEHQAMKSKGVTRDGIHWNEAKQAKFFWREEYV